MRNSSHNSSNMCQFHPSQLVYFSLVDIVTLLVGQPVIVKLLWITFTSKKTIDILNFNLALFHNVQYLISIWHLICVLLGIQTHKYISRFLLVYVETGGPMGLSCICLERYVAVIHPTSYPLLRKYRFREACALTVWLISVPLASLSVLTPNPTFFFTERVLTVVPLSVMLVMVANMGWCSFKIARALKKSGPGRDELHPVKKRALQTVCATYIITMSCYFPVTFMQSVGENFGTLDVCITTPIYMCLLSAASVVHPVLYLSTQGALFASFKALFTPCRASM